MAKYLDKHICSWDKLQNERYLVLDIVYKKQKASAIVFEFDNTPYAYLNNCMHMQRPLNCQQDTIFDETGKLLRCSMHGFVFEPTTGECLSPVCEGQKLQLIKVLIDQQQLYFSDKHVELS